MKKNWKQSTTALLLALALLLSMVRLPEQVNAASLSVLEQQLAELKKQNEKAQAEIDALEEKRNANATEIREVAQQKDLIDQEVFYLYGQIENINQQMAALSQMIADKQEQLHQAQKLYEKLRIKHKERIRAMEENGSLNYWSVLFEANSFSDLLDRLNMIEEIAKADRVRLQQMYDAAQEVEHASQQLEQQKLSAEQTRKELEAAGQVLAEKRAEADKLLAQLAAKDREFAELMQESEQSQDELMEKIADKEAEYKQAEYEQWLSTSVPATTTGGSSGGSYTPPPSSTGWLVPIKYNWFTSPFGMRYHPSTGVWKMHRGVDLAADTGTPIVASRSGIVSTTSYEEGGAGFYVSINHGDGYSSIYMHMTHYIVSPGQYVAAGQVIGYCGSTGLSTGPHLHFGISYNGTYVNPADYIDI